MKQKIVIEIRNCDKCRSKAKKIAADQEGVNSIALEGADKNQVVVIGEDVDTAQLTHRLRKKAGYACLSSVEEVKPPPPPPPQKTSPPPPPPPPPPQKTCNCICTPSYYPCPPCPMYEVVFCDPKPSLCNWLFG